MYDELRKLTKHEKRFLSRRICALCEIPLSRDCCGAIFHGANCTPDSRTKRREACLATYKPRERK